MSTVFRIPILVTVWRCLTFPYSRCGLFGGFWLRTPRCSSLLVTASFKDPQSRSSAAPASIRNVHWHHHIPRPKEQPKMGTWNQAIPSNDHKTEWLESRSWKPSKSTGQVFQTTSSFLPNLEIVAVESFPLKEPMPMCTTCCFGPQKSKNRPLSISQSNSSKKATKSNQIQRYHMKNNARWVTHMGSNPVSQSPDSSPDNSGKLKAHEFLRHRAQISHDGPQR